MSSPQLTARGVLLSAGLTNPVFAPQGDHTLQVSLSGTGTIGAQATWQGSNDKTTWDNIATVQLGGTDTATSSVTTSRSFAYWRLSGASFVGTVSSLQGLVSSEDAVETNLNRLSTAQAGMVRGRTVSPSLKKLMSGRFKTVVSGTNHTTVIQTTVECAYNGVRVTAFNLDTVALPNLKIAVGCQAAMGAFGDPTNVAAAGDGLIAATFAGAASGTIPARFGAELPGYLTTDLIPVQWTPRTDGGVLPLMVIWAEVPWVSANFNLTVPFTAMQGWKDGLNTGGRIYRRFKQNVAGVSVPANFNTASLADETATFMPLMIEYFLDGNLVGVQHYISGDSIDEGLGATDTFYGFQQRAVYDLSTPSAPREYFNGGMHGQTPQTYVDHMSNMIALVAPNVVSFAPYSVNSISTDLTTSIIRVDKSQLGRVKALCSAAGASLIVRDGLPCNRAFKDYTNDSRRVALNAELLALNQPKKGLQSVGVASIFSGSVDPANGQTTIAAGLTAAANDPHPNDLAAGLLKVPVKAAILAAA